MNVKDREQLSEILGMVVRLDDCTPQTASFKNGNYTFRVKDALRPIREGLEDMLTEKETEK